MTAFWTLFIAVALGIALGAPIAYLILRSILDAHHRSLRGAAFDTTDRPDASPNDLKGRSGLRLYIDHGTGVHYLAINDHSGLTPRLMPNGTLVTEDQNAWLNDRGRRKAA